ncbi:FAD binding domain-containingprotein [Purpureocillium lilacinum]|uniref:FAD binding domain-containingprotein n=1 Tax=Purpureocillium lilacinum TaxID=33203 RepID=A0A179GWI4_PURLI|nr:FAD binding domain-containingprotein [Purpureocillium lilacinum]OAQ82264.1 FAD binding domain-containingprotein [Purpureocillium lilacinum]OAQ92302.1 FAD binding domain-containingprotein [Purpureocillium lilacinum]GJN84096.1 hypothetical protein PLIIFM63780_007649 [Purpureocillium lilacinum]
MLNTSMTLHPLLAVLFGSLAMLPEAVRAVNVDTQDSIGPATALAALNASVGGRVKITEPFALPCFATYEGRPNPRRDTAVCAERQANYRSSAYRSRFPGGYMYDQSSVCATDPASADRCLLDPKDPSNRGAFESADCRQGNVPAHYLEVKEARDVVEAFRHAEGSGSGLRIVVKNSGHSFELDSSGKRALSLWTHNLKKLTRHRDFVPDGCGSSSRHVDAITTGAGVTCNEAYSYADAEGVLILCGYSATVGLTGGWVQNGGHSVLSNMFGLGADRVLQFTVVTPDGVTRVANRCQNADLFWALRGGGGGTFGVVLDATHKVEPAAPIAVANISVPARGDVDVVYGFMETLFDSAVAMAEDGWGGHIYGNSIAYMSPKLQSEEEAKKSMAPLIAFAEKHSGSVNVSISPRWYPIFDDFVLKGSYPVGDLSLINTRLVPVKVHTDKALRAQFKAYMREFISTIGPPYVPVDAPYLYRPSSPSTTSVHPAWYSSLWEWGYPNSWAWNGTLEDRVRAVRGMQAQTARMEAVTPGGGTYKNEANPFTPDWQRVFFGGHYERLLAVKRRYDPRGLLRCWRCVGWTDEDAEASCYRAFNNVGA